MAASAPTSAAPTSAAPATSSTPARPWIWSAGVDLGVFGGSALLALLLVVAAPWLAPAGELPAWAFVAFVVLVDVAHVHTTLFRTYLDRQELASRPWLYAIVPLACYGAGVALHLAGERVFWRLLAYLAVLHFIRQQVGWVAIYRARAGERSRLDRRLDEALVYLATGFPLLVWHASPPRAFRWFVEGDFALAPSLAFAVRPLGYAYAAVALLYVARTAQRTLAGSPLNVGKHVVVGSTMAVWYVGIVATNSEFAFTVTNVLVHGVPYMALLWFYSRERARETEPTALLTRLVARGVLAFLAIALVLAFAEEALWEALVWHDGRFGIPDDRAEPLLGPLTRAFVVPLLALPQATHYALDAVLWRRRDTGLAQARALGFPSKPPQDPALRER